MNRSIPKYYKPVLVTGIWVTIDQLLDLPIFMLRSSVTTQKASSSTILQWHGILMTMLLVPRTMSPRNWIFGILLTGYVVQDTNVKEEDS